MREIGKYIVTDSFTSNKVIASGKDPSKVLDEAAKKGVKDPVINFVYKKGIRLYF